MIPEKLRVTATYSPNVRLGLNYFRGLRDEDERVLDVRPVRMRLLRLSDFVAGLALLSIDDIHALRNSDELSAYSRAMCRFAMNLGDSSEVVWALASYRMRIYDRIKRRLGGIVLEQEVGEAKVGVISAPGTDIVRFVFVELFTALLGSETNEVAKAGIRYLWDRFLELGRRQAEEAERAVRLEAIRKQQWAAEVESATVLDELVLAESPIVESSVVVDKKGVQSLVVGVSR